MELVPYVGENQLTASSVIVRVSPADRKRVTSLIARMKTVQAVVGDTTFHEAKRLAGESKAMLDEIETARKASKAPFRAIGTALDELAGEVGDPLADEHQRILMSLNAYVAELERKAKEAERKKAEALRIQNEANERKLKEAADKLAKAQLEARQAKDEAERLRKEKEAAQRLQALAEARLEQEMDAAIAAIGSDKPKPALVSGGRVDHPWKFELKNILEVVAARRFSLLRWSLDVRACQDAVKEQLEKDPNCTPVLPGIRCWQEISVSVKASARTE
jgi:hypothetical protein